MFLVRPSIVVTMDRDMRILKDCYIGIEDGKIVYIGKSKPPEYDELIDLSGRVIIPGFINAHTHVAMTLLRGVKDDVDLATWLNRYILPIEMRLKPSDVYFGALYGIAEMLKHGIVCFLDMYYHELEVARAAIDSGIRAVVSYGSADVFFGRSPQEELRIAEMFRQDLMRLIEEKDAHDRIFFAYGPHSPYGCTKELLILIKEKSDENNARIHIHLSETRKEVEDIKKKTGMSPIEYLDKIGFLSGKVMAAHVVWPQEHEFGLLASRGVHVLHNPTSNLKLASGIAPVQKMLKLGINVALATDGPASNNRLDIWKEMHIASLLQKGILLDPEALPAREVLKMATINGARALGLENFVGSIEIGKKADFIVIDVKRALESTPIHDIYAMLVYALDSRIIESVWIDGRIVYHANEGFRNIDIDKVRQRVQDIRDRLMSEIA